jgi:hypothetical protein
MNQIPPVCALCCCLPWLVLTLAGSVLTYYYTRPERAPLREEDW